MIAYHVYYEELYEPSYTMGYFLERGAAEALKARWCAKWENFEHLHTKVGEDVYLGEEWEDVMGMQKPYENIRIEEIEIK